MHGGLHGKGLEERKIASVREDGERARGRHEKKKGEQKEGESER